MASKQAAIGVRRKELVQAAQAFADALTTGADKSGTEAPLEELRELARGNFLTAPLPFALGGLGLGTEPGGQLPLLRMLAAIGGGDLALGRLLEGHVNALILVATYGTPQQLQRAADDAHAGLLFGVWNTGEREPMRVQTSHGAMQLQGCKAFATGADMVKRPIVTAERSGWQMTLPRLEAPEMASALRIDRDSWQPFGMQRSESFTIDLTGVSLGPDNLLGAPGDFYQDPLFRGGAVRFAAVQAGAIVRLRTLLAGWLEAHGRGGDPYQIARLGDVTLAAQEAVLWVERAAAVAEDCLVPGASRAATRRMVDCANMTRVAIERIATATIPRVIAGVGARGLLRPARFERLLRDLTMYLRQPNPDGALADVGLHSLSGEAATLWMEQTDA